MTEFKERASKLSAPELHDLFDQLQAEGDAVPLEILLWVSGEYHRARNDPLRSGR